MVCLDPSALQTECLITVRVSRAFECMEFAPTGRPLPASSSPGASPPVTAGGKTSAVVSVLSVRATALRLSTGDSFNAWILSFCPWRF